MSHHRPAAAGPDQWLRRTAPAPKLARFTSTWTTSRQHSSCSPLSPAIGRDLSFEQLGYEVTEHGARIDWDTLASSPLTANERGLVRIAHGCMTLERAGGCGDDLADVAVDVIARVVSGERPVGSPLANVTNAHDLWWNDVVARLNRCSVYGSESLRRSTGTAFHGDILPAAGRELPGWERDACLASCEKLATEFVVRDVLATRRTT